MRLLSALGLVALLFGLCPPARAQGTEWEELILDGMRRQDSRLREVSLDAVVRDQELLAARPASGAVKVARLYLLGRAYGKRADSARKDVASARQALQEVLALEPGCYFAHRDLGILALSETPPDPQAAEASLQRALSANPSFVQALRDLARLCSDQKRPADAIVYLRRVIDLEPSDLHAGALLVLALLELHRVDEARRQADVLLKGQPTNPMFRDVRAEVELAAGNLDAALTLWRQLQAENPSATKPLWGQWRALTAKGKAGQVMAKEDLIGVIDRLFILEREPQKRLKLKELGDALRAPPPDPSKPPDDAALLRAFESPDEEVRVKSLAYVTFRPEKPSMAVLRGVIARIVPSRELAPAVRASALAALAQQGGFGLLGLVRHSLHDPNLGVRRAALLAVESMGEQHDAARRSAFLILGGFALDADRELAAGARAAILRQAGLRLTEEEGSEAEQLEAWKAWWAGPMGTDHKIRALHAYAQIKDPRADQVLVAYLEDPDVFVVEAAYKALVQSGPTLSDPKVAEWVKRIPRFVEGSFQPEKRESVSAALKTWLGMPPPPR